MEGIHYVPFHSPNRVVRLKMSNKISLKVRLYVFLSCYPSLLSLNYYLNSTTVHGKTCLLADKKKDTPSETHLLHVKAEQICPIDSTRSGSKFCCNCTTKRSSDQIYSFLISISCTRPKLFVFPFVPVSWLILALAEMSSEPISGHPKTDLHRQHPVRGLMLLLWNGY